MRLMQLYIMAMILLVWSSLAHALNTQQVENFVNAMRELKPYFDQYADESGDDGDAGSTAQLVRDWAHSLRNQGQFMDGIKKYGFEYTSWQDVSEAVMQTYLSLKLGAAGANVSAQLTEFLKSIEDNPDFSPEQKAEVRASVQQSLTEFEKSLKATPEDQAMVRPHLHSLDEIFGWQE